jgi:hypothetical protein
LASTSSTKYERALLEGLCHAVHGVHVPFAVGGTLVPEQPVTLCFPDNTQIAVLRARDTFEQQQVLRPLVERCTVAAFGMGRKTRYDRSVRDALQIKAEGGAFSVLHFDPAAAGILEQIRRELAPHLPNALTAELYNLNVYGTGGHFVPHKDTPRGSDMLGTLVVCLPAQFSNGALVVKHHGVFQTCVGPAGPTARSSTLASSAVPLRATTSASHRASGNPRPDSSVAAPRNGMIRPCYRGKDSNAE